MVGQRGGILAIGGAKLRGLAADGALPFGGGQRGVAAVILAVQPDDGGRLRLPCGGQLADVVQQALLEPAGGPAQGIRRGLQPVAEQGGTAEDGVRVARLALIFQVYPIRGAVEAEQLLDPVHHRLGAAIVIAHELGIGLAAE
jgi:hypothetical protein